MLVSDFDYHLPEERIAQKPLEDRAASRMLVVDRAAGRWQDRVFRDLPEYFNVGDRLVVNDSKVFPARLFGRRAGMHATTSKQDIQGLVEVLLLQCLGNEPFRWEVLVRPGRKMRVGEVVQFPEGLEGKIVDRGELGLRVMEFSGVADFYAVLDRIGHTPLPPYIKRSDELADRGRYQTVYAERRGSVAAPTAGLHFDEEMLGALDKRGVVRVPVTLHVGLGTFRPVQAETVEGHKMHSEKYEISEEAAAQLGAADSVTAVGTTSLRLLEHAVRVGKGLIEPGQGETDLFIYPGFEFRVVDRLLTNFHLPKSTLLMLVCAFGGRELVLEAYEHARAEEYRFYSYGDCMLVV